MEDLSCTREAAEVANYNFEQEIFSVLSTWVDHHEDRTLLRLDQSLGEYLANDALRDFFLTTPHPLQKLLTHLAIAEHLSRRIDQVYFDPLTGDPLLAAAEQRIYNLVRRMDSEIMHIPFRSVQANKQTDTGDIADINTYPEGSEELRYNSGNHFTSRPANINVFDENSERCMARAKGNLHVLFKRGYLEERLHEVKELMADIRREGNKKVQYFVVYSRHSVKEGHFGVSLLVMDPANPDFPQRVLICDTLLKELPHHPRWWNHFIAEFSNVFGDAIAEVIEDLSHPLQKVNLHGDEPYRHDWDCPYYAASMAEALSDLVKSDPDLILNGSIGAIHNAMKVNMPDYYNGSEIKDRSDIKLVNRAKRWESGRLMIRGLMKESRERSTDML